MNKIHHFIEIYLLNNLHNKVHRIFFKFYYNFMKGVIYKIISIFLILLFLLPPSLLTFYYFINFF